uniref:dnaJ homolog subfamily C member 18-like n=1 Tax=Erigeron canadensis TaxID=72917 RepID=UPI001CB9BC45|nr:dnaJ homolog subfamily C member 18-like [Erigeron canadensis]
MGLGRDRMIDQEQQNIQRPFALEDMHKKIMKTLVELDPKDEADPKCHPLEDELKIQKKESKGNERMSGGPFSKENLSLLFLRKKRLHNQRQTGVNQCVPAYDFGRHKKKMVGFKKSENDNNYTKYYEILGVTKDATPDELRKAYRKAAILCHPDKGGDPIKGISYDYRTQNNNKKRVKMNHFGCGF